MFETAPETYLREAKESPCGASLSLRQMLAKFPPSVKNDFSRHLRPDLRRTAAAADSLREKRKGEPVERTDLIVDRSENPRTGEVAERDAARRVEFGDGVEQSEHSRRHQIVDGDPPAQLRCQMSADLPGRLFGVIPNEGEITFREPVAQLDIAAVGGIPPPEFVNRLFDGIPPGAGPQIPRKPEADPLQAGVGAQTESGRSLRGLSFPPCGRPSAREEPMGPPG